MSQLAGQTDIFDALTDTDPDPLAAYRDRYARGRLIPGEDRCPGCGHLHPQRFDATNDHHLVADDMCLAMDLIRRHVLIDLAGVQQDGTWQRTVDGWQQIRTATACQQALDESARRARRVWSDAAVDEWLAASDAADLFDRLEGRA